MRDFNVLDPISLRAFYIASESPSFSEAARRAGLTQSGISQHIARLEEDLNVDLFLRMGRKVVITPEGRTLRSHIEHYLDQTEQIREALTVCAHQPVGWVRYSMPNSCLMTPHFAQLLTSRKDFPQIDLRVRICASDEVVSDVLSGDSDFGFVTKRIESQSLTYRVFAHEEYVLVGSPAFKSDCKSVGDLGTCDFVRYPGMEVLYEQWADHAISTASLRTKHGFDSLKFRGEINNLAGAITMVKHGVGLGIFPKHCVEALLESKTLAIYNPNASKKPARFPIYIVHRLDRRLPRKVKRVLDAFWEMSTEAQ